MQCPELAADVRAVANRSAALGWPAGVAPELAHLLAAPFGLQRCDFRRVSCTALRRDGVSPCKWLVLPESATPFRVASRNR